MEASHRRHETVKKPPLVGIVSVRVWAEHVVQRHVSQTTCGHPRSGKGVTPSPQTEESCSFFPESLVLTSALWCGYPPISTEHSNGCTRATVSSDRCGQVIRALTEMRTCGMKHVRVQTSQEQTHCAAPLGFFQPDGNQPTCIAFTTSTIYSRIISKQRRRTVGVIWGKGKTRSLKKGNWKEARKMVYQRWKLSGMLAKDVEMFEGMTQALKRRRGDGAICGEY